MSSYHTTVHQPLPHTVNFQARRDVRTAATLARRAAKAHRRALPAELAWLPGAELSWCLHSADTECELCCE